MPGYSTVTVVGPRAVRDVALPRAVPVAELLVGLRNEGVLASIDGDPARWALTTATGRRLPAASTLSRLGVADGHVLYLRDVTEDHVDDGGAGSRAQRVRIYVIAVATVAVAAGALTPGRELAVLLTGALICAMAVFVVWWSASVNVRLTYLVMAGAVLWAWRTGHLVAGDFVMLDGVSGEIIRHTYGVWAGTLLILIILNRTPLALPFLTGLGVTAIIATPVSVALLLGIPVVKLLAVAAVVVIFEAGILPRVFMSVCAMLGVEQVRTGEHTGRTVLLNRLDGMLVGVVVALAALGALSVSALAVLGTTLWTQLLPIAIGAALLTRSRVFDQARHAGPFGVAGAVCLVVVAGVWLNSAHGLGPWSPAILVLAALLYVAVAAFPRSGGTVSEWIPRSAEIILVAAILAIAAQILGLYDLVGRWTT